MKQHREEVCLGNCTRFHFKELQVATNNFSSKKLVRKGGFGKAYKGYLQDGTVVAVKRLKDRNEIGASERLLVYPHISNGSVATRLKAVRGTVGHIAPEYPSTSQSSEKTDVFGLGILLLELISGLRALEFGKTINQKKGVMLDWKSDVTDYHYYYIPVRKTKQEKKLEMIVDKDLKNNYDRIEVEGMVQVALLCTQYLPSYRLKMSEVVWMLEGGGLAEKWEASQRSAEATSSRSRANALSSSERYSDLTDDSS
ncbi:nsp-interacting kinase 2 -like protein [Gossypium arboreum]|uniref:non-specific serine/threonine protein kinase n=2 Tax=Gossypium arboreum TaxID=29729 RepID=A0A0B0N6J1_GOSAR|nr:nsp-interacting kinase 2 -like protein [Gossypium arboreum]